VKLDSIIQWFMPKEEKFHLLFRRNTANLRNAGRVFGALARSTNLEERRVKMVELEAREHEGDLITRQVFEALNSTFITPLDREDIRALASDLDDVMDYLEGAARLLVLFELAEAPEALTQFAGILETMIEELDSVTELVWDLRQADKIGESLVRVSELENQADALYQTVIADLFKRGRANAAHTVELLEWKEVYDGLENACDACKEFTHVIGNIVTKNA
jgi:predicted phosphate transport protein (TIGR00153 family)